MQTAGDDELEVALARAANGGDEEHAELFRVLVRATVHVPGSIDGYVDWEKGILHAGTRIQFRSVQLEAEMRRAFAFFSSLRRLRETFAEGPTFQLPTAVLLQLKAGSRQPLIIDAGAPHARLLWPVEIDALVEGRVPPRMDPANRGDQPTRMRITRPHPRPQALLDALAAEFRGEPAVRAAYVAQWAREDGLAAPSLVVPLDAGEAYASVTRGCMDVIRGIPGISVEFVRAERFAHLAKTERFYTRGTLSALRARLGL